MEAGISDLKDYLLSKELYWPIFARGYNLPRLTIGGVLLAAMRLESVGEQTESHVERLDRFRLKWRGTWEAKAGREFKARFRLWQNYLGDYTQDPERYADAYGNEVRYRVMLALLLNELPMLLSEQDSLSTLDGIVRANLIPRDFIWDPSLQSGFPREVYWYLYGKLKA